MKIKKILQHLKSPSYIARNKAMFHTAVTWRKSEGSMPLHPIYKEMIQVTKEANNLPVRRQTLTELRKVPQLIKPLAGEAPPTARIMNHMIESKDRHLILRLYYPREGEKLPILLYFHPGFFIRGDVDSHDTICRQLAIASDCIVASVNYSLSPEHRFPAPLEDGHAALMWMARNPQEINADGRLAIGGENAGGNLAAALTHRLRDEREIELDFQVLIYPQVDLTLSMPSVEKYGYDYLLEKEALDWYISKYLPPEISRKDPRVSPLFEPSFDGLPKALVITAEFDPLKDEGEAYAKKLKEASIPTIHLCYPGMAHGFFQMGGVIDEGKNALEFVGKTLKEAFAS